MKIIKNKAFLFILMSMLLILLFFIAINVGSIKVSPIELFNGLFLQFNEKVATIYDLRFPRIIIAMLAGSAIAVSGVLFQSIMKNPLADPAIIGVSSAASFVAVVVVATVPTLYFYTPILAIIGGLLTCSLIYTLSWKSGLDPLRIILTGIAINAVFTGMMEAFSAMSGSQSGVASIINANISMKTWNDVHMLFWYVAIGLGIAIVVANKTNMFALEDKTARSLGVNIMLFRLFASALAVILACVSTAIVGVISFLGLIVPHMGRAIIGSDNKYLIPFTILLGAFVLLLADTIGRVIISPYEISAPILMAIVGGPFFIVLLKRSDQIGKK